MLEAMTQASAWLIRASEDFAHSMVVLKEARNVKYANFLAPGDTLTVNCEITKHDETQTKLKVKGTVDDELYVKRKLRSLFNLLRQPGAADEDGSPAIAANISEARAQQN